MADDVFDARRKLRQRTAQVEDKIDKVEQRDSKPRRVRAPRGKPPTNIGDVIRGERKGSEGERSFGAPIDSPAERLRKAQTTDSNN